MSLFLLFVLSFFILSLTCFSKVLIVLQSIKQALGLNDLLPQGLLWVFAIILSLFIMLPVFEKIELVEEDQKTISLLMLGNSTELIQKPELLTGLLQRLKPVFFGFLDQNTEPQLKERILKSKLNSLHTTAQAPQMAILFKQALLQIFAFLLSELYAGFLLALWILLPFLLIDLIIAQILLVIGTQGNQNLLALPIKIALFLMMDGWLLISEKLILSYQT